MNIFRKIEDFEDYEVDNDGNVKSIKKNIILKPRINRNGYIQIGLFKNKTNYLKSVHRLVAEAFLQNPLGLPCVNHKDENKQNNHVELELDENGNIVVNEEKSNLEWCTIKYNNNYGTCIQRRAAKLRGKKLSEEHKAKLRGRKLSEEAKRKLSAKRRGIPKSEEHKRKISESHINNPLTSKAVVAIDKDGNVVYEFTSIQEAGRNGFCHSAVCACCRNCYWKLGNYYKGYQWFYKSEWLQMQKEKATPRKKELPYQLELNLV